MFGKKNTAVKLVTPPTPPPPPQVAAPVHIDPAGKRCPLRDMALCTLDCAWHTGEVCAMRHTAIETYFIADALRSIAGPTAAGAEVRTVPMEMEERDCNL